MRKRDHLYKHQWWLTLLMLLVFAVILYATVNLALNMLIRLAKYGIPLLFGKGDADVLMPRAEFFIVPPNPIKPIYMALLAGAVAIPLGFPLVRRIQQKLFPDTGLEGDNEWASTAELKQDFSSVPITVFKSPQNNGKVLKNAGLIVAQDNNVYYTTDADTNTMVFGSTRSGKTQRLLLPTFRMMIFDRRSFIVNDMKGELIENLYDQLQASNYRIRVLNLRNPHLGNGWDLLHQIKLAYISARKGEQDLSEASELISDLAYTLTDNPKSDPVWPESARALLEAVIRYLLDDAYDNDRLDKLNMYGVVNFYTTYAAKNIKVEKSIVNVLDMFFNELSDDNWAKQSYATCQLAAGDMLASIRATLASNLSIFNDVALAQMTTRNEIRFEELYDAERPTAIFVIVPDEKTTRHKLMSLFITQSYAALIGAAFHFPRQRLPRKIVYMIDEFGILPAVRDIGVKLSASLSRGVSFYLCIQDQPQLEAKYGKEVAKNILNNCSYRMYVLASDPETNKYVSEILGRHSVEYSTYMGDSGSILNNRRNTHIKGRELKKTDELQRLKEGQIITLRLRGHPILSDMKPYYKLKLPIVPIEDMGLSEHTPVPITELIYPFVTPTPSKAEPTRKKPSKKATKEPAPQPPVDEQPQNEQTADSEKQRREAINACNLYTGGTFGKLIKADPTEALALAERLLKEKKITPAQWGVIERMLNDDEA